MRNRLVSSLLFLLTLFAFNLLPFAAVKVFPPVATGDSITTAEDTPVIIAFSDILENDTAGSADFDLNSLVISRSSNDLQDVSHGKLRLSSRKNEITYTPQEGFRGNDEFQYQVCDAYELCTRAKVQIKVAGGNEESSATEGATDSINIVRTFAGCEENGAGSTELANCVASEQELLGYVYGRNVIFGTSLPNDNSYRNWLLIAAAISLALGFLMAIARKYVAALLEGLAASGLLVGFYFALEEQWFQEPNGWFGASLGDGFWIVAILAGFSTLYALFAAISLPFSSNRNPVGVVEAPSQTENAEGTTEAMRMVEEAETGGRETQGYMRLVVFSLAVGWSLFQLSIASWLILPASVYRAVHLAFAITLVFMVFPIRKGLRSSILPWYDYLFARIAATCTLYLVVNHISIQETQRLANQVDIIVGSIFLVLLLEATRRSLGPALTIIGVVCLFYAMSGPQGALSTMFSSIDIAFLKPVTDTLAYWFAHPPDLIAHKGQPLARVINQMFMTSEGVFGVALGVSAQFVFLFVLFGAMLDKAGAGKYFIDVANSFLGGLRGGPAKASVVASGMTGMVSGSSLANVVTTGTFTIPLMKRTGYPPHKAAATEVAVSTNGQIMPPVMGAAAFLIAEYVGIKYFDVVRAAVVPALIAYIALFYIVHLEALKLGLRGIARKDLPPRFKTFVSGIHYIAPLAVLIYFLVVVRVSPGFAVMYAIVMLIIVMFLQEPIKAIEGGNKIEGGISRGLNNIVEGLESGARNMIGIAVAVATAGIVVGTVNFTGLGLRLTEIIEKLSASMTVGIMFLATPIIGFVNNLGETVQPTIDSLSARGLEFLANPISNFFNTNPEAFNNLTQFSIVLLLTAIASLILGLGLPTTANYIVMATLTAPIIVGIGSGFGYEIPLIAAHMFVFFFGILADDTPPVGLAAYAAAAIARTDPIKTGVQGFLYDIRTAILPFMFIFNTKLLLIGVNSWAEGIHVFISALIGMFAFSAATQGFALRRLNWLQRILLLITAFMLIQPSWTSDVIGLAVMIAIYAWQWLRSQGDSDNAPNVPAAASA